MTACVLWRAPRPAILFSRGYVFIGTVLNVWIIIVSISDLLHFMFFLIGFELFFACCILKLLILIYNSSRFQHFITICQLITHTHKSHIKQVHKKIYRKFHRNCTNSKNISKKISSIRSNECPLSQGSRPTMQLATVGPSVYDIIEHQLDPLLTSLSVGSSDDNLAEAPRAAVSRQPPHRVDVLSHASPPKPLPPQ